VLFGWQVKHSGRTTPLSLPPFLYPRTILGHETIYDLTEAGHEAPNILAHFPGSKNDAQMSAGIRDLHNLTDARRFRDRSCHLYGLLGSGVAVDQSNQAGDLEHGVT
jgi:hypothetical protein